MHIQDFVCTKFWGPGFNGKYTCTSLAKIGMFTVLYSEANCIKICHSPDPLNLTTNMQLPGFLARMFLGIAFGYTTSPGHHLYYDQRTAASNMRIQGSSPLSSIPPKYVYVSKPTIVYMYHEDYTCTCT